MVHIFRYQIDKDVGISLPAGEKTKPTIVINLGGIMMHVPLDKSRPYIAFPSNSIQVENNLNLEHHIHTRVLSEHKERRDNSDVTLQNR